MLEGREYFYDDWLELVVAAARTGPVLDLGTPQPFQKEMAVLRGRIAEPYWCVDYVASEGVTAVADAHRLPFREGSIGSVLCSHVLEHVEHPQRVIDESRRVLKKDGRAYFTFLDVYPYHARKGVYADYHRFKSDAIRLMLAEWHDIRVVTGGGVGHVATNYVRNPKLRSLVKRLANVIDQRWPTNTTTVWYVRAAK